MTEAAAISRLLSVLHSIPLWLLAGLAVAGYATLFAPSFGGVDLTEFRMQWGAVCWLDAVSFTVLAAACAIDLVVKAAAVRAKRHRRYDRDAYFNLYAPLSKELLKIHITTSSATLAPRLSDRMENAWIAFSSLKRRRAGFRAAWRALFDKRRMPKTGEVDYGGDFPIEKIERLVQSNRLSCDDKLSRLLGRAKSTRWEDPRASDYLSADDVRLYDYIMDEADRLKKRVRR